MNCLICNETLTEANASDEHIILNSLGGHLHSKDLLCKKCNNKFGKEADAALADTLKFAASQLDAKRYRGENQVIQTSEKEKYDLAPGCKPVLKKPEVRVEKLPDGKMQIEMSARSTQEARKILKCEELTYKEAEKLEAYYQSLIDECDRTIKKLKKDMRISYGILKDIRYREQKETLRHDVAKQEKITSRHDVAK